MREACRLSSDTLHALPGAGLPEPDRTLLDHARDMTSTLADFHRSPLRVEILQQVRQDDLYLREVFLRTQTRDQIVEYGVIAIALEQFTAPQREAIQGGYGPLGGLLHQFKIPFVSAPIRFFSVASAVLTRLPFGGVRVPRCHGRLNHLSQPTGEPLAWILEILPPAPTRPAAPIPTLS